MLGLTGNSSRCRRPLSRTNASLGYIQRCCSCKPMLVNIRGRGQKQSSDRRCLQAGRHYFSSSSNTAPPLKVWEIPASQVASEQKKQRKGTLYVASNSSWEVMQKQQLPSVEESKETAKPPQPLFLYIRDNVISHFLPAQYPHSVAKGYDRFIFFNFFAAVAGSSAMVLSTQTLLLAVGVVGSGSHHASIMAGAVNWVLKDGLGQLGGVIFASRMGQSRSFDADPKKWRTTAAFSLDSANLLEILSPLIHSSLVLPLACIANVGKNIGWLTASASRAALHQSMAIAGNLADVTAKAGSQTMAASLCGTGVGIGLSWLLNYEVGNFIMGFACLSLIHQGCNYAALKNVTLLHLSRHRLHLVLTQYMKTNDVPSPSLVSQQEFYLPFVPSDDSYSWLSIGSSLQKLCPGPPEDLMNLLSACPDEAYVLNLVDGKVHLVFLEHAKGEDLLRGMMHAYCLREATEKKSMAPLMAISVSHTQLKENYSEFFDKLRLQGWRVGDDVTSVEGGYSCRLTINPK